MLQSVTIFALAALPVGRVDAGLCDSCFFGCTGRPSMLNEHLLDVIRPQEARKARYSMACSQGVSLRREIVGVSTKSFTDTSWRPSPLCSVILGS